MTDNFHTVEPGRAILYTPAPGAEPCPGEFLGVSQTDHRGAATVVRCRFGRGAQIVDAKAVRLA